MTSIEKGLALAQHAGYWTEVYPYPDVFLSDTGKVASFRSGKLRLLKGTRRGQYLALSAIPKGPYIHQLMCEIFRGPRPAGAQVRHLDGNSFNNDYRNVNWGTPKQNAADKRAHGTDPAGERNAMAKLTTEAVAEMRRLRQTSGMSYRDIGRLFGVSTMTAYRAVEKQSWK